MQKTVSDIRDTINGTTDSINKLLDSSKDIMKISKMVDSAFETQAGDARAVADTLDTVASKVDGTISSYTEMETLSQHSAKAILSFPR